jgi:hypothetical protein
MVPLFAVERIAMIGRPPRERAAPRIESACPPMPLKNFEPIESSRPVR